MPFKFHIDTQANVIRETWSGTVDLEQLQESCRQEWTHPDYKSGMSLISDFRIAEGNITADEVLWFASWFSCKDTPVKHAIVVSRELGLDLAEMYTLISGATEAGTQIFLSYAMAESWIMQDRYFAIRTG
ncbi:MAG: hypothetical protein H7Y02_04265 [Candidatus Obscuribacterales bacterium]|nr:hypothetical protein [Steroidobacteraceae bacterium]